MSTERGMRNVAFEVDDLQAAVDRVAADGNGLVGGIGRYEDIWRMASCADPKGSSCRQPSGSADATVNRKTRSAHAGAAEAAFGLPVFARRASQMPNPLRALRLHAGAFRSGPGSGCPISPTR